MRQASCVFALLTLLVSARTVSASPLTVGISNSGNCSLGGCLSGDLLSASEL